MQGPGGSSRLGPAATGPSRGSRLEIREGQSQAVEAFCGIDRCFRQISETPALRLKTWWKIMESQRPSRTSPCSQRRLPRAVSPSGKQQLVLLCGQRPSELNQPHSRLNRGNVE